jgi:hypothetical protein
MFSRRRRGQGAQIRPPGAARQRGAADSDLVVSAATLPKSPNTAPQSSLQSTPDLPSVRTYVFCRMDT